MITNNTDLFQCSYLPVQDTELDSLIDKQLPPELIGTIFSKLSSNDIASSVSPYWKSISVGITKREEADNFSTFIHSILDNLDEKNAETKTKIKGLISEAKISDDSVVNLLQIKETLIASREKLISLLKELDLGKQRDLKAFFKNEKKPLYFQDIFAFVPDIAIVADREGGMHNIAVLLANNGGFNPALAIANHIRAPRYPVYYRAMRIGH